jgi:MFS transporter, NNP family, nitrate/nitrite transporter
VAQLPKWRDYAVLLREPDAGWFCFFYSFTFGGFVGLASFLTTFFHDQYALSKVQAGDFTTVVVLAGSFLRPIGGWLSDKIGGYRLLENGAIPHPPASPWLEIEERLPRKEGAAFRLP